MDIKCDFCNINDADGFLEEFEVDTKGKETTIGIGKHFCAQCIGKLTGQDPDDIMDGQIIFSEEDAEDNNSQNLRTIIDEFTHEEVRDLCGCLRDRYIDNYDIASMFNEIGLIIKDKYISDKE